MHGRVSLDAQLRHSNISISDVTREEILPKVLGRLSFNSLDELHAAIGYGGVSAHKVVNRIRDELRAAAKIRKKEEHQKPPAIPDKLAKPVYGVMVEGLDNCLVKFAKCCSPVPGDSIVGFITRGFGVSVHRQDCSNYIESEKTPEGAGRWVRVTWADTGDRVYQTEIRIAARDRTGLVVDVASILNKLNIKITSFSAKNANSGAVSVSVILEVRSRDELTTAMSKLLSVTGVTDIRRADG